MEEAGRSRVGRLAVAAQPGVQADVVVVAARAQKRGLVAEALLQLEAEHVSPEPERALGFGHLEVGVADIGAGSIL